MHYTIRVVPEHIMKLTDWGVLYVYIWLMKMKYSIGRKFQTVIWSRPDSFSAGAYSGICPGGLNFLSFGGGSAPVWGLKTS